MGKSRGSSEALMGPFGRHQLSTNAVEWELGAGFPVEQGKASAASFILSNRGWNFAVVLALLERLRAAILKNGPPPLLALNVSLPSFPAMPPPL